MTQRRATEPATARLPGAAAATSATAVGGRTEPIPLTERILARLPGSRSANMLAWAAVPWLNLAVVFAADYADWVKPVDVAAEVLNRFAASFAVLLALWGAARTADELGRLRPALVEAVEQDEPDVAALFRGLDSTAVPLLLTVAVGLILPLDEALRDDPAAAALQGLTWLVIGVPLATAVWVYVTVQLGLNRLGIGRLTLRGYRGDRSLGLQPVGAVAFTGFWMLLGTVTPLVLTGGADPPSVLVGAGVLLVGVGLFFWSLRGLHRQMTMVKQREVGRARRLYQQAHDRIRDDLTLEQLERHAGTLNAAEAFEKRAERIQSWPFDEGTFARFATIASSAVATIIARLLLTPAGL